MGSKQRWTMVGIDAIERGSAASTSLPWNFNDTVFRCAWEYPVADFEAEVGFYLEALGFTTIALDGEYALFTTLEGDLTFACRRAEQTGEVVVAMHGFRVHRPSTAVWSDQPWSLSEAMTDMELLLAESTAGFRETYPDVTLVTEVIPVGPATLLVDASLNASLVVVGSRGLGPVGAMLLGSVSHHVLHRAQCPDAIVR